MYTHSMFKKIFQYIQKSNQSEFGFAMDAEFRDKKKWVSALTPYLIEAIISEFNPILISNQKDYDKNKYRIRNIISLEPGWAVPKINYDTKLKQNIGIFVSDPHNKVDWLEDYVSQNNISHIFSYYHSPFFYHFPNFPKDKFVHFPWAIPDQFINGNPIKVRNNEVIIFGGKASDAYDVRNWCREQDDVKNYNNSGVENKVMSDEDYFKWLQDFDAIIAAGSSKPIYDLVTPKYFEVASAGTLLFGQHCKDLERLGFNNTNCIIFTKENFIEQVREYKKNPENYLDKRINGRNLIKQRHTLSKRIELLKEIYTL